VQGLDHASVPVEDVEVRDLADSQAIKGEPSLAVPSLEGGLVATKGGDDAEPQQDQRQVLGPPLARRVEAELVSQLLPAMRAIALPIALQEPLEARQRKLEDPRRDLRSQDLEHFIE